MDFNYCISPQARVDLLETIKLIHDDFDNPQAAARFNRNVYKMIGTICSSPYLFPKSTNERLAALGIRYAIVGNYLLLYVPDDETETVNILRIVYARRDLDAIEFV